MWCYLWIVIMTRVTRDTLLSTLSPVNLNHTYVLSKSSQIVWDRCRITRDLRGCPNSADTSETDLSEGVVTLGVTGDSRVSPDSRVSLHPGSRKRRDEGGYGRTSRTSYEVYSGTYERRQLNSSTKSLQTPRIPGTEGVVKERDGVPD